jgi:putative alpha-1,2-mannosidase
MASLGLFDVKGLTDSRPVLQFGSPLFDKADIMLGNSNRLVIEAINNSPENVYIQSAELNGQPLNDCWIYRDDLMKGGKLTFTMGAQPNTAWGTTPPPSVQ